MHFEQMSRPTFIQTFFFHILPLPLDVITSTFEKITRFLVILGVPLFVGQFTKRNAMRLDIRPTPRPAWRGCCHNHPGPISAPGPGELQLTFLLHPFFFEKSRLPTKNTKQLTQNTHWSVKNMNSSKIFKPAHFRDILVRFPY